MPSGLEIDLPLDGSHKRGRIPPTWTLRVWLNDELGFWRADVQRDSTFGELRAAVAQHIGVTPRDVRWRLGATRTPVSDDETVESARLFERTRDLVAEFSAAVVDDGVEDASEDEQGPVACT